MVSWWIVAFAVLFPLAQVPLVLWIGRYVALDEDEQPVTPETRELWTDGDGSPSRETDGFDPEVYDLPEVPGGLGSASVDRADDEPATRRCPDCGAENDPTFRFCGECAAEL